MLPVCKLSPLSLVSHFELAACVQIVSLVLVSHFELDASVQIVSLANVPVGQDLRPWNTFSTAQPTTLSHATLNDRGVGLRWGGWSGGGRNCGAAAKTWGRQWTSLQILTA